MAPSTHPELSVMHIPGPTGLGKCERTESIIAVGRQRLHVEVERYRVVGINRASGVEEEKVKVHNPASRVLPGHHDLFYCS